MTDLPEANLTMLTLVKPEGQLEVSFERRPMPVPKPHEVLVKVLASPINPSDLGLLFGGADMTTARASTRDGLPVITADVPPAGMRAMGGRIGDALAIGNEGCGTVVAEFAFTKKYAGSEPPPPGIVPTRTTPSSFGARLMMSPVSGSANLAQTYGHGAGFGFVIL